MLTIEDGTVLVRLARNAIETYFSGEHIELEHAKAYSARQGAFATLKKGDRLRGCVGYPEPLFPLYKAVVRSARAAAFQDPRFPPLWEEELEEITITISVLTTPEEIKVEHVKDYLQQITIGRHGLMIRSDHHGGLLLPEVASEYLWTPKEFLVNTCRKAGLPDNAWMNLKNKIYRFRSQIFTEETPKGNIIEKKPDQL